MEISSALAILGLVATIAFGVFGVYLVIRHRYPGRITYISRSAIGLFDSIVGNLPELTVLYNNDPVKENLVLLRGLLLNTGSKDITPEMIEEPLSIDLPEGFKWVAAKISHTRAVRAVAQIEEQTRLTFDIGLFRCKEYFEFESLAEIPSEDGEGSDKHVDAVGRLLNAMSFSHRIADTRQVDRQTIPMVKSSSITITIMIILVGVVLGVSAFLMISGTAAFQRGSKNDLELRYIINISGPEQGSTTREVRVKIINDSTLALEGVNESYSKTVSAESFYSDYRPELMIVRKGVSSVRIIVTYLLFGLIFIGYLIGVPIVIRNELRDQRIRSTLREYLKSDTRL